MLVTGRVKQVIWNVHMSVMTSLLHMNYGFSLGSYGRKLLMEIILGKRVKTQKGFPNFITDFS